MADGPLNLYAYSDSSFADCIDSSRSTLGYVCYANGVVVSAYSKLASRIDSCINHSELQALTKCVGADISQKSSCNEDCPRSAHLFCADLSTRDIIWLRNIKADLERRQVSSLKPTSLFVDNQGVISILEKPLHHAANKHLMRDFHELREHLKGGHVQVIKIDSSQNRANPLTKQPSGPASVEELQWLCASVREAC